MTRFALCKNRLACIVGFRRPWRMEDFGKVEVLRAIDSLFIDLFIPSVLVLVSVSTIHNRQENNPC